MNDAANSLTRILFVDDSKVMLKTAAKILMAEFDMVTAIDGDDAWGKLEQDHAIQVVFTDINMPGTDGYGLLEKIRTADDPGMRAMPVILVTGADDADAAREKAMENGATDFIDKRALRAELLPRARAYANYQRITRQLQAQSTLDALTGLSNEAGFLARFEQDIFYARRHGQALALLRVEIADLVATFQYLGEDVIEQIVVHMADLIRTRIRHEDTAARIGLGGFAISAAGGTLAGIEAMASGLQAQAATLELDIDGKKFPIILHTAAISAEPDGWTTAQDAMERCRSLFERQRQAIPVPPAPQRVEPPQPVVPAPTPKPVAVQAAPRELPAELPLPQPVRDRPAPQRVEEGVRAISHALQRTWSSLRKFGARQGARLARFLRNLVDR